jgi:hypothetical protein
MRHETFTMLRLPNHVRRTWSWRWGGLGATVHRPNQSELTTCRRLRPLLHFRRLPQRWARQHETNNQQSRAERGTKTAGPLARESTIYSRCRYSTGTGRLTKNCRSAPRMCGNHAPIGRPVNSSGPTSEASRRKVRAGLEPSLARLWRYALMLSRRATRQTMLAADRARRSIYRGNAS